MKPSFNWSARLLFSFFVAVAAATAALPAAAQDRYAALVMDARTNEVLFEDQADLGRYPASLTKMMTLYMLFEAVERGDLTLDTRLTASRNASRQPASNLGLRRGSTLSVEQAILALAVRSANDVATVVAERLGGSEARFAANMTSRARELGMANTRFGNASGLPNPNNRTTARDMAVLAQALWRDFPEHYHVFQTRSFMWGRREITSHNHLLGQVEGVDGIKTGYIRASGFNLATMAERNGRRVIVVVMGGQTSSARDAQVAYFIEGAYEEYARRDGLNTATYASFPMRRLDMPYTPGGAIGSATLTTGADGRPLPPSGFVTADGQAVEVLAPAPTPLRGEGDQAETADEDMR